MTFKHIFPFFLAFVCFGATNASAQHSVTKTIPDRFILALTEEAQKSLAAPVGSRRFGPNEIFKEAMFFRRLGMLPLQKDKTSKGVFVVQVVDKRLFENYRGSTKLFRYVEPALQTILNLPAEKREAYRPPVKEVSQQQQKQAQRSIGKPGQQRQQAQSAQSQQESQVTAQQEQAQAAAAVSALSVNDPLDTNWGHGAEPGANIRNAWDISTGDSSVIVAVLGSGINLTHPDLAGNLWKDPNPDPANPKETVDGFNSYNVSTKTPPNDDQGTGSYVAGIIGAVANNEEGIAGVAYNSKLLPVRVAKKHSFLNALETDLTRVIEGITYVIHKKQLGANIAVIYNFINFTSDPGGLSPTLQAKIGEAASVGILFVTAAGDNALNLNEAVAMPGHFDLASLISVGAYNRFNDSGLPANHYMTLSNYGTARVDLAAPGQDIKSCWLGLSYNTPATGGTPAAGAYVAGVAALLRSKYPDLSLEQLKAQIVKNVRVYPELASKVKSSGVLDAVKALNVIVQTLQGDFDDNGIVDGADFMIWQRLDPRADGNKDGKVDGADLQIWKDHYGTTLNPTGLPGDFDKNGSVDGGDFLLWQRSIGAEGPNLPCDGNNDGKVDGADLQVWKDNYGRTQ